MELRVGCPMWAHPAWVGPYLPSRSSRGEQLAAYATWCTAVEGNTTFYAAPSPATVRSWAAQAPPGFRFLFKMPAEVTHRRRLRNADRAAADFVELLEPLGDRASTLWLQLPASFGPVDVAVLRSFVARLPRSHRVAVEVRHLSFFTDPRAGAALERALDGVGAEWVSFDTTTFFASPPASDAEREAWTAKPRVPLRQRALTDQPIVRYIGRDDPEATVAGWSSWLPVVVEWLSEGRSPTVFVHTPDNHHSIALARRFHDDVRALLPELDPLPTPVRDEHTTLF